MYFCYVFLPIHHHYTPENLAVLRPLLNKGTPISKGKDSLKKPSFLQRLCCFFVPIFFGLIFLGWGKKVLVTLLAGVNPRNLLQENMHFFTQKPFTLSIHDNPFPNKKKSAPHRTHLENEPKIRISKKGWIFNILGAA